MDEALEYVTSRWSRMSKEERRQVADLVAVLSKDGPRLERRLYVWADERDPASIGAQVY